MKGRCDSKLGVSCGSYIVAVGGICPPTAKLATEVGVGLDGRTRFSPLCKYYPPAWRPSTSLRIAAPKQIFFFFARIICSTVYSTPISECSRPYGEMARQKRRQPSWLNFFSSTLHRITALSLHSCTVHMYACEVRNASSRARLASAFKVVSFGIVL